MQHKLVKFEDNYADEFDVEGFKTFTPEEFESWERKLKLVFDHENHVEIYFGTNEYCGYCSLLEYQSCLTISSIFATDVDFIRAHITTSEYGYGHFLDPVVHYEELLNDLEGKHVQ